MGKPGQMEMKCDGMSLLVINIVSFLLGLALLIVGFVFRAKTDVFRGDDVMEVLNDVNVSGSMNLGDAVNKLPLFLIYLGAGIILNSCLGAYGACYKISVIIKLYMCFCIAHLIAMCVCLALLVMLRHTIDDETTMKAELSTALVKYKGYDNSVTHTKSNGWNLIFIDLECCGVDTVSASNDEFSASEWASTRGTKRIPVSCCNSATKANYKTHTDPACTDAYTDYNTKGCYDAIDEVIKKYDKIAIAFCAVLIVVEHANSYPFNPEYLTLALPFNIWTIPLFICGWDWRNGAYGISGTKWCGMGNIASDYDDLGELEAIDTCCRSHDHCTPSIGAMESKYGLFNFALWAKGHCDCDAAFYDCLKAAGDTAVGDIYFNQISVGCIAEDYPLVCVNTGWWGICTEYAEDTSQAKVMMFKENTLVY